MKPSVIAVHLDAEHRLSKITQTVIELVPGYGVKGDAHYGKTVQHLYAKRKNPHTPNLRQVHLIQQELFAELKEKGFEVLPGILGENITTVGLDLLALPSGTKLFIGEDVLVELTGLRTPCSQINDIQPGLMQALFDRDEHGEMIRKAGVMAVIVQGGMVKAGDEIRVALPEGPHQPLQAV